MIEVTSKYKLSKKNFDVFVKSLFSEAKGGNSDLIFRTKMGLGAQKMSKMKTPKQKFLKMFPPPIEVNSADQIETKIKEADKYWHETLKQKIPGPMLRFVNK